MNLLSINPSNNKIIESHKQFTENRVNRIIDSSHNCFLEWRKKSITYRSKRMLDLAELLKQKNWAVLKLKHPLVGICIYLSKSLLKRDIT